MRKADATGSFAIEKPRVADMIDMDMGINNRSFSKGMSELAPAWVSVVAISLVVLIYVGDWITPATVVVGLAYQAPVVFAGLKGTRKLVIQITVLGIIALAFGWFQDLVADSYHFSSERIENRLLSVLSLLIVCCLTVRGQRERES